MSFGKHGASLSPGDRPAVMSTSVEIANKEEVHWIFQWISGVVLLGIVWLIFGGIQYAATGHFKWGILERFIGAHDISREVKDFEVEYVNEFGLPPFNGYHQTEGYKVTGFRVVFKDGSLSRSFDCVGTGIGARQPGRFSCPLYLNGMGSGTRYEVINVWGVTD